MSPNDRRFELLKDRLLSLEQNLGKIVGDDPENLNMNAFSSSPKTIAKLLFKRCCILNKMFIATPNEIRHFSRVNAHLIELRKRLQTRTSLLSATLTKDPNFDDGYIIEGSLRVPYNGNESVLILKEDSIYESDFRLMNSILEAYYISNGLEAVGEGTYSIDRGIKDCFLYKMNGTGFSGITIGSDTYDMCVNRYYSYPDFIRLNDFWAEAKIVGQCVTSQTGKRYSFPKK